ncbi:winged helix-turn-helix transcriptional regulator [Acinetobacter populi]|jgi:DNA-binding HxlR family transcriptional regulator|uniref:MarR family transcriptional regulator n=1 Tax=Acinetobacter populi TaxID=1582270 RepID=A0A1Z9Z0Y4_9GAMM|nr:helix-turn-helix domain-containing protein [Acinetobacter populi]MCH4247291.1 helix-turn-helix transcriptional regulator [Acinetobacter populi]OUY08114.1 MarR family transcriptional regulator [Acinetobacter populi]
MAKLKHSRFDCVPGCSVEAAIGLIDGKWKCIILWHLLEEKILRFNQLKKHIPNVTQRTLTNQLRELEQDGLIIRTVYPQVPPKVEYQLSQLGQTLAPILIALKDWGDAHISLYGKPLELESSLPL